MNHKLPTIAKVTITVHCAYDEADLEQLQDEILEWYNMSDVVMSDKDVDITPVQADGDQLGFFQEYNNDQE